MDSHFTHSVLPVIGKRVFRMGIAGNYGIDSTDVEWAAERGFNYWVCGHSYKKVAAGIRTVIAKDREKHVVALLGWGFFGWQVRRGVEKTLRQLKTDYLDVFKLGWLGRMSAYTEGTVATLVKLKQEGKIKAIGTSIHDRERAGRLAADSEIDLFMIRYNAKHPGAEEDIFPHLAKRNPVHRFLYGPGLAAAGQPGEGRRHAALARRPAGDRRAAADAGALLPVRAVQPPCASGSHRPQGQKPTRDEPRIDAAGPPDPGRIGLDPAVRAVDPVKKEIRLRQIAGCASPIGGRHVRACFEVGK
jgi:hypothetical protein